MYNSLMIPHTHTHTHNKGAHGVEVERSAFDLWVQASGFWRRLGLLSAEVRAVCLVVVVLVLVSVRDLHYIH